jgi:hypothetical protein
MCGDTALVLRTTNGGTNWTATSFIPTGIAYGISVAKYNGIGFYWISGSSNIYRSTDNGISFSSQQQLSNPGNCISMVNASCGWCGTNLGMIYRYYSYGAINHNDAFVNSFQLSQNYPNPFNPVTTIEFSIPKSSNVSLKIYDVLGNQVMNVMNEFKPAGNYSVNIDASKLSSGIYFYTLTAVEFMSTKKMLLIR